MYLKLDSGVSSKFPGLLARIIHIHDVSISPQDQRLEEFKAKVLVDAAKKWQVEALKDAPIFRAYRDFFWRVKVDPTKTRPAAEALLRRVLRGNSIPTINTLVDSYNLASVSTSIPFGAFDLDKMRGEPLMREAWDGEEFLGIGMDKPARLSGGEAVIQDEERLIAIYPYRDADYSKVTTSTRNLLLMTCGVPGISDEELIKAEKVCLHYITRFCGGTIT